MSLSNDKENEMCQICEAGGMVSPYFEELESADGRREGLKSRYGGENPMDCPHGCGLGIVPLVASCL